MSTPTGPDSADFTYDEFAFFHENCAEYELEVPGEFLVQRISHTPEGSNTSVSALRWGEGDVQLVLLHGGAQNSHTWDTTVLAMGQPPSLAIDLPGHGKSDWRDDRAYHPHNNAEAVASFMEAHLEEPVVLVGMSLGGLTATRVAATRPDLVKRLVVLDITPGVTQQKAKDIHDFVAGPQTFATFDEIFERTVLFNPTRSEESLRRGILHNAHRTADGSWQWNYDRNPLTGEEFPSGESLWDDVSAVSAPYLLLKAEDSPVVDDADIAEFVRLQNDATVRFIEKCGHSIQGDQPVLLAEILAAELAGG
jgi:pimeloyl-ACP methyl ester carboxylesterase